MRTLLAAGLMVFLMSPAMATEHPCAPRNDVIAELKNIHHERMVFRGLLIGGKMIEVFMARDGEFSIVLTQPELPGWACIIGTGKGAQTTPVQKMGWRI